MAKANKTSPSTYETLTVEQHANDTELFLEWVKITGEKAKNSAIL